MSVDGNPTGPSSGAGAGAVVEPPEPPERPESGPWRVAYHRYAALPNVRTIDRWVVRRVGFSPMASMWMRSSGNAPLGALLLETIGRRTGEIRPNVLPYFVVDGEYVILGTKGGAPTDPSWVGNIRADPHCWAWVDRRRRPMLGRIADDDERQRLAGAGVWHTWLENYQVRARSHGREVPFVVLTPRSTEGAPSRPSPRRPAAPGR